MVNGFFSVRCVSVYRYRPFFSSSRFRISHGHAASAWAQPGLGGQMSPCFFRGNERGLGRAALISIGGAEIQTVPDVAGLFTV